MRIGLLLFSKPGPYSGAERFIQAAQAKGHELIILQETELSFLNDKIFLDEHLLPDIDVIISRAGCVKEPSLRTYAVQLLLQAGYRVLNAEPSFAWSKNKITQLVFFAQQNLPCPAWGIAKDAQHAFDIAQRIGFPVMIKIAFGTHGKGVFFAENSRTFQPIVEYLCVRDKNPVIIQEYIHEADQKDLRIFLLGGKIIAGMERAAPSNDVRANTSRGGVGFPVQLSQEEIELAERAAQAFHLDIAGVDIIRSSRGPLLLEVNSNPGFKELERVTGQDIAGAIIDFAVKNDILKPL